MDDLCRNGLMLFQDDAFACFSADAVWLSDFLRLKESDVCLELGAGTGAVCVLGADKTGARFCGVEKQERLVALAKKSAAYNHQPIAFYQADATDAPALLGYGAFTAVVFNPPFFDAGEKSPNASRALSRHDASAALTAFVSAAFLLLKNGGKLFLIYPAQSLCDAMCSLRAHRLEPKRLRFVCPAPDLPPIRVLIEARKLGGVGLTVEPPLFVS